MDPWRNAVPAIVSAACECTSGGEQPWSESVSTTVLLAKLLTAVLKSSDSGGFDARFGSWVAAVRTLILRLAITADASRRRRKCGTPRSSNHCHTLRAVSGKRSRGRPMALSVPADQLDNATKPSPFTDNAGSSMAAIAGRMSRVEVVKFR